MSREVSKFVETNRTCMFVFFPTLWDLRESVMYFFFFQLLSQRWRSIFGMKQILRKRSVFSSFSLRFSWDQKLLALNICNKTYASLGPWHPIKDRLKNVQVPSTHRIYQRIMCNFSVFLATDASISHIWTPPIGYPAAWYVTLLLSKKIKNQLVID